MAETRNLCAQIPLDLHAKVQEEKDELGLKLSDYVTNTLKEVKPLWQLPRPSHSRSRRN